jgi:hypothetical protein
MGWQIIVVEPAKSWLHGLRRTDRDTLQQISAELDRLADKGPGLGRPLVDTLHGSSVPNMKELRPGSTGQTEVRLLFVFDPERNAVVLVGGDKSGNWKSWYPEAIKQAEAAYHEHLQKLIGGE